MSELTVGSRVHFSATPDSDSVDGVLVDPLEYVPTDIQKDHWDKMVQVFVTAAKLTVPDDELLWVVPDVNLDDDLPPGMPFYAFASELKLIDVAEADCS